MAQSNPCSGEWSPRLGEHGHKMKPLPHLYEVSLSGGPTGHATLLAAGVPPLRSAPPKEFDGPGDAWSPEQFLLAAVETCFMFTFRAVAQRDRRPQRRRYPLHRNRSQVAAHTSKWRRSGSRKTGA